MTRRLTTKTAFDWAVAPVMQVLLADKADELLHVSPDPELRRRIEELAERSTEGQLTEAERAEYEGYVRANSFVAVLRHQAERITGGCHIDRGERSQDRKKDGP